LKRNKNTGGQPQSDHSSEQLQLLCIAASASRAALIVKLLQQQGFSVTVDFVDSEASFIQSLRDFQPEIIIAEYAENTFGAADAINILKTSAPEIPVLIVAEMQDEAKVISLIGYGAEDYILQNAPARLPLAIRNVLAKQTLKKEKQKAEEQTGTNAARYNALLEHSESAEIILSAEGTPLHVPARKDPAPLLPHPYIQALISPMAKHTAAYLLPKV